MNATRELAVLRDTPADPILHNQARPCSGIQQFILPNADKTMCIPLYLKRNNGRIQRFLLFKAMLPNTVTNQAQRILQDVWLLIPGNPRISVGANNETYFGDQSQGMINFHLQHMIEGAGPVFNMLTAMVTPRNMHVTPNKKYGIGPDGNSNWREKAWPILKTDHIMLCGGKMLNKEKTAEVDVIPLENGSEMFEAFMQNGFATTETFMRLLVQHKLAEPNTVFEVMPGTIEMGITPYYGSRSGEMMMQRPNSGIRRFHLTSNWSGVAKVDIHTVQSHTGNERMLTHGVREVNGRYAFDRIVQVYDRRNGIVDARLSLIDPVTIRYLEGSQTKDQAGEEDGIETNIPTNNRKSRAKTLEEVAQERSCINFSNVEMRVHPNGKDSDSNQIVIEFVMVDHSTYTVARDTSKLGNVANVDESGMEADLLVGTVSEFIDFDAILNGTNSIKRVEAQEKPAPDITTVNNGISDDINEDLPF